MDKINPDSLDWERLKSPQGKFRIDRKNISLAMGAPKDTGRPAGHAIDVALNRIPPGKINWPLHAHGQQTEIYLILSGTGKIRLRKSDGAESTATLAPGDCVHLPPCGDAHQLINDGEEDLVYYVIADNPAAEHIYYPDSDKYTMKPMPNREWFRLTPVHYYDGEE